MDKSNLIRSPQTNNVTKNSLKRKIEDGDKVGATQEKLKDNQVFEVIEIDLDEDLSENTSLKNDDKLGSSDIQCNICKKKLASNMALKMHNNLKHPIKKEVDDAEMLLGEENDDMNKSTDVKENDEVKNEIEKMETLELLDNLVNFLNDA